MSVKIYTTPSCVYCRMSKDFFQQHNVEYQEFNVALDAEARQRMIETSGQFGVPVIDIDGELVIGFDRSRLAELLHIK